MIQFKKILAISLTFILAACGTAEKETNIDKKAYIHLGVYGFKFSTLKKIINLPNSENDIALKLEQMLAMDNNILIHMIKSVAKIHLGIDTHEDLELANKLIGND